MGFFDNSLTWTLIMYNTHRRMIERKEAEKWRVPALRNPVGIDPYKYETEDEYIKALTNIMYELGIDPHECASYDEAYEALDAVLNQSPYDTDDEYLEDTDDEYLEYADDDEYLEDTDDEYLEYADEPDAVNEEDYPSKRLYTAALYKADFEAGDTYLEQDEIEKCDFVLENYDNCIAARYFSVEYDEFLYAQAVKENFSLPFSLPDEDEYSKTSVCDLLCLIYKKCHSKLFVVWKWLTESFVPFVRYSENAEYDLSTEVISYGVLIGENFLSELAEYISEDKDFGRLIVELSPDLFMEYGTLFTHLLKQQQFEYTRELFEICAAKDIAPGNILNVINGLIEECKNYDELETMELFEQNILPIIKNIDKKEVKNALGEWENEIKEYYDFCETSCEQYSFTRRNSWRSKYKDEADELFLYVTDYENEEDFLKAYHEEKYAWRNFYTEDETYGLDPADFETEDELTEAIEKAIEECEASEYDEPLTDERYVSLTEETKNAIRQKICDCFADASLSDDRTIYTYIGVLFPQSTHIYHYLTDDDSISIGDSVVVPVDDDRENVAQVVSVEKHLRVSAPFPVEKTKRILRKYEEE